MGKLTAALEARIAASALRRDPAQLAAAARLDQLLAELAPRSLLAFGRRPAPRGVYLWGGVGGGKTLLMDLFHALAPAAAKRRAHFHDFMQETHAFIHRWRGLDAAARRAHPAYVREAGDDPIAPAARAIALGARVLSFDELHVASIADAMILGRLFDQLFDRGVTLVATSNRPPDGLYKDGVNRQLFLPFIERLKTELDVVELQAATDYRLERLSSAPVYHAPLSPTADAAMDAAFAGLTAGAEPEPEALDVGGRTLDVPAQAAGAARFSFAELCEQPLGAADYLALARRYHTLVLDRVPRMGPERRNAAARFVTLIDALYDAGGKLVMSAEAEPQALYPSGDGAFEFGRTASRLMEMRSAEYLAAPRRQAA